MHDLIVHPQSSADWDKALQEGLEAPPAEEQLGDADLVLDDEEDLSFASMFNSMRLEEADEPSQAAQPRNIQTPVADLDPVIPYGSFGQVFFQTTPLLVYH